MPGGSGAVPVQVRDIDAWWLAPNALRGALVRRRTVYYGRLPRSFRRIGRAVGARFLGESYGALSRRACDVGDRRATLSQAVDRLAASSAITLVAQSDWHETPAVGGPAGQPPYLNGAVLLHACPIRVNYWRGCGASRAIWVRMRRCAAPCTLDLDLLLYDELVLASPDLTLPHPRMAFRRFVLEPAAEVAADMRHPLIGWTIREFARPPATRHAIRGNRRAVGWKYAASLPPRLPKTLLPG